MASRALAAVAGRRMAGPTCSRLLVSWRRGAHNYSNSVQSDEHKVAGNGGAAAISAAQVEAALNSKNVEVLREERATTVLPGDVTDGLEGEEEDAWVPDQETGVFAPGDEADTTPAHPSGAARGGTSSVLDQTVFVRDEDMEDVERPAVDIGNANAKEATHRN